MTGTNARSAVEAGPPLIAVALISAAALAFEILLMRLFSIILWHHFAYMIISLALLGYGASGALLTVAQRAVQQRFAPLFCAAAAAFGVSAIGCFALAQRVPFNPLEILWDPRQPAYLLAVYLLLALPFLCAGACVCMAFSRWRGMASRIYSFDILGARGGKPRRHGPAVRAVAAGRIEVDRRAGVRSPRRWRGSNAAAPALAGGSADGHGGPALADAAIVGRARDVAVQGVVADPAHSRGAGRGGTLQPAGPGQRGRESAHCRCATRRA